MTTAKRNRKMATRPEKILPGRLYSTPEMLLYLRIDYGTFAGIIARRELPYVFVGRCRRFYGQDILNYLAERKTTGLNKPTTMPKKARETATDKAIARLKAKGMMK